MLISVKLVFDATTHRKSLDYKPTEMMTTVDILEARACMFCHSDYYYNTINGKLPLERQLLLLRKNRD